MKKLFTILAMLMFVLQYSMAGTATFNLGTSPGTSMPAGFFTHGDKWNFNTKFNGAEYGEFTFSNGLKMESTTAIYFTTTKVSTVTIVQSTWSEKTIKFDDNELAVTGAVAGTGCRIYTLTNVDAGNHSITQGNGESGLFYVKVEWVDVYTATYNNTTNWENVYAYAWVGDGSSDEQKLLGPWPGTQLRAGTDGKFPVEINTGLPENIIFNNGSSGDGSQTANFVFKNGAEYNFEGRIVNKTTYTATFTTEAEWTDVYAYCWNNTESEEALGAWPGTKITATGGVYQISIDAEFLPEGILFHNNEGWQTPNYTFADGAAFEYNKNTYTVTFTTDAEWENVYAWAWSGSGDNLVNHCAPWPGQELTADAEGVYTFTYSAFDAPEMILFNDGADTDTQKTPDWTFTDGKAYKYITATPIFAIQPNVTYTYGQTVNVKDADGDVVVTITFGNEGQTGNDFNQTQARTLEGYIGYQAATNNGNGTNGDQEGGTTYTVKPLYDGILSMALIIGANKAFYIQEDGTTLSDYNGKKYADGYTGIIEIPVTGGKSYKFYCSGSKLNIFGFDYTFTKTLEITNYYLIGGTGDWEIGDALTNDGDVYSVNIPYESAYSFAIAPNTAIFESEINWKRVIRPESQTEVVFENTTGTAVAGDGSQNWKMRTLDENESNAYTATLKYNPTENTWSIECSATVTISNAGYATYSNAQPYKVEGAEVYTVSEATTKATFNKLDEGAEIPGGKGVILKGTGDVTITPSAGTAEIGNNLLIGSGDYSYIITDYDKDAYIFQNGDNGVGFYKVDLTTLNDDEKVLPAHKAFLKVSNGGAPFFGFDGNDTTGINSIVRGALSVGECYTLDGRRVEQPTKGLYIINGKKVVVK